MQQRLIAPCMEITEVTRRTGKTKSRDGRMYPHESHVRVWKNFHSNVLSYSLSDKKVKEIHPDRYEIFRFMVLLGEEDTGGCRSQAEELDFLLHGLNFLESSKIVGVIERETGTLGRPDFTLKDSEDRIGVIVEGKSTHTLLIPSTM